MKDDVIWQRRSSRHRDRSGERGNVILITAVIMLSFVALALGTNLLLQTSLHQEIQLQTLGDVPTQARNSGAAGLNQLVYLLNAGNAPATLNGTSTTLTWTNLMTYCTSTSSCTINSVNYGANNASSGRCDGAAGNNSNANQAIFPAPIIKNQDYSGCYTMVIKPEASVTTNCPTSNTSCVSATVTGLIATPTGTINTEPISTATPEPLVASNQHTVSADIAQDTVTNQYYVDLTSWKESA